MTYSIFLNRPILIWQFSQAPEELRALSRNEGDEDWLALIPPHMEGIYATWLECPAFGCAGVDVLHLEDGSEVRIGYHS